jgi:hypothetical protein
VPVERRVSQSGTPGDEVEGHVDAVFDDQLARRRDQRLAIAQLIAAWTARPLGHVVDLTEAVVPSGNKTGSSPRFR